MFPNIKTSSSRENNILDGDVFVLIKRLTWKDVLFFAAKDYALFVTSGLAKKMRFSKSFLTPSNAF